LGKVELWRHGDRRAGRLQEAEAVLSVFQMPSLAGAVVGEGDPWKTSGDRRTVERVRELKIRSAHFLENRLQAIPVDRGMEGLLSEHFELRCIAPTRRQSDVEPGGLRGLLAVSHVLKLPLGGDHDIFREQLSDRLADTAALARIPQGLEIQGHRG